MEQECVGTSKVKTGSCRVYKAKNGWFLETCEMTPLPPAMRAQLEARGLAPAEGAGVPQVSARVVTSMAKLLRLVKDALAMDTVNMPGVQADGPLQSCEVMLDIQAYMDGFGVRLRSRNEPAKDEEEGFKESDRVVEALSSMRAAMGAKYHDTVYVFETVDKVLSYMQATL